VKPQLLIISLILGAVLPIHNVSANWWWDMTPWEVREKINRQIMEIEAPASEVFSIEDRIIKRDARFTPIRIYSPNDHTNLPIMMLIHGGAWVAGNMNTHDNLARYLCAEVQAIVVSVEYLNAPEGKFPVPLEQCYDALLWIEENAHAFSGDPTRLAIIGDSAGGNLTAALCLMARDLDGPKIDMQVLINPAPDLSCNGTIVRQNDALDPLRWSAKYYLSDPQDAWNDYASPLLAEDLSNLPNAVVLLAQNDDLQESGQLYADRLKAAGVSTFVYCQNGIGHLAGHGARASLQARESLDVAVVQLKKILFSH